MSKNVSTVYFCDRCGARMEAIDPYPEYGVVKRTEKQIAEMSSLKAGWLTIDTYPNYDLCPDCKSEFLSWLLAGKGGGGNR